MNEAWSDEDEKEWAADCVKWRGRVLTGRHRHWCTEWDFLPIDETTPEFEACQCVDKTS